MRVGMGRCRKGRRGVRVVYEQCKGGVEGIGYNRYIMCVWKVYKEWRVGRYRGCREE